RVGYRRLLTAGAATVLIGVCVSAAWLLSKPRGLSAPQPLAVVIADFRNDTGDPAFEHSLEPLVRIGLEGASFISAYDRSGISSTFGVKPPEKLDDVTARDLAVKQGLGVVLSGSVDRQGDGYSLVMTAIETITGKLLTRASAQAASKEEVPAAATRLVANVRRALGDDTSDSVQMFAMASLSAKSVEVLHYYAEGRDASSKGQFNEAKRSYTKALALDPEFGIGHQALAGLSLNQGNVQDAEMHIKEALRRVDGMTDRERHTTRGAYYAIIEDYEACVKEYRALIMRYPAEVLAHNNLALCLASLSRMSEALDEMRRLVTLLPRRPLFRINLALYAIGAGDFLAA